MNFAALFNKSSNPKDISSNDVRINFPNTLTAIWISTTLDHNDDPITFITNASDGFLTELEKLGQAATSIGTTTNNNASNSPYSIAMRPVTDLSQLFNQQNVYLNDLSFFAYDTLQNPAGLGQTQTVIDEIVASLTAANINKYAVSQFLNGMVAVNWQPNFFRPQFKVNDQQMIPGMSSTNYGDKNNLGDLSIGTPLPWCFNINKPIGKVSKIEAFGQVAQIVDVSGTKYYQRYPLICVGTFYYGNSNKAQ